MALIDFTDRGMYCKQADVYIDPWKPVNKALITHGHSDHARSGSQVYLTHHQNIPVLQKRLHAPVIQGVAYGETITINGVAFSFHPAGHVLGSSQVRVEYQGEIWVASGDYKLQDDGVAAPFEPVTCHTFITESTFGLPVFNWNPQTRVLDEINAWWNKCKQEQKCAVLFAYSLGKAQRILKNIDTSIGEIFVHGAVDEMNLAHKEAGIVLPQTTRVNNDIPAQRYRGALVIAPSSADQTPWMKKLEPYATAAASGWMALRGARRWQAAERGFVLSDHADWRELNTAVKATGAEHIIVTHGYTHVFAKWLTEQGLNGITVNTHFTGDGTETTT